jgi:predicted aspartyl protease
VLSWGESTGPEVNGAPVEETTDFYQYTDNDGVIHFVDSREKIPRRYLNRLIVRKEKTAPRQTTDVVIVANQIQVPISIKNGDKTVQATLLLDTGATITCITEAVAARLKIDLEKTRLVSMGLADGRMIDIHVAKVDSVAVGDRGKSSFKIGILPNFESTDKHEGYLGMDFLGSFQYRIDLDNNLIRWQ